MKEPCTIAVIPFLLISCSPLPSIPQQSHTIQITSVVDHITGEPVITNTIWVTIERGEDDSVEFIDSNISDFRVEIPVGVEAYILVEAPGYVDWEMVGEASNAKYEEVIVGLLPVTNRAYIDCQMGNTLLYFL